MQTENIVSAKSELAVVGLLSNLFDDIAYMDEDTVRHNIELATDSERGMPKKDRAIRAELANYLLSHFSLIYVGLVINDDFRDAFTEAVSIEIAMDNRSADSVARLRSAMKQEIISQKITKGHFVVNLSEYNDGIYRKLNKMLSLSFEKITQFDDTMSELIDELTEDDKIAIGYCVSNFMYLFRAFSKNELFVSYVKTILHNVQSTLGIKL